MRAVGSKRPQIAREDTLGTESSRGRGRPSSLHGLWAHRTQRSNENQPHFFQPKDLLCF